MPPAIPSASLPRPSPFIAQPLSTPGIPSESELGWGLACWAGTEGRTSWTVVQQKLLFWAGQWLSNLDPKWKKLFSSWHAGSAEGPADSVKPPCQAQSQAMSNLGTWSMNCSANLLTSQEWAKSTSCWWAWPPPGCIWGLNISKPLRVPQVVPLVPWCRARASQRRWKMKH